VFRSQAEPCYPENSQRDGCYPDNAALPSRFMCWLIGQAGSGQPGSGQPDPGGKRPRRFAARPGNAGRRAGRSRDPRHIS
jgi:hypothetical protein